MERYRLEMIRHRDEMVNSKAPPICKVCDGLGYIETGWWNAVAPECYVCKGNGLNPEPDKVVDDEEE